MQHTFGIGINTTNTATRHRPIRIYPRERRSNAVIVASSRSSSLHSSRSSTRGTHYHSNSSNTNHNMLKVVGASWMKTRISTMIIAGSLLLAVGSLYFIVVERPQQSGTYCATVYWSVKSNFRTQYWGQQHNLSLVPVGAARSCYSDSTLTNGYVVSRLRLVEYWPLT